MKYLKNLFLLVFSLIFCIVALEFCLTKLFPKFDPSCRFAYYTNPDGVILGPKNFKGYQVDNSGDFDFRISINKYGFRDKKDLSKSSYDNIFVVGDSFSFGYGVREKERFSNFLEFYLNDRVYNIAIPGNFNDYEKLIKYAIKNGARIKKLIIGVCMENDLADYSSNMNKQRAYISSHGMAFNYINYIKNILEKKSTTYNIIAYIAHQNEYLKNILINLGIINDVEMAVSKGNLNEFIIKSSFLKLKEISNGFDVIILIIPSRSLWMGGHKNTEKLIHDRFVTLIRDGGLPVVDMRPIFECEGNPLQYHFPNNGHWNANGHKLAANAIAKYIKESNFLNR